jgi:hypothetical protein
VVALHATDPASVYISASARTDPPGIAAVAEALDERRELVRMLGMRRTMFVLPADAVPVVEAACTRVVARRERAKLLKFLAQSEIGGAEWLAEVEEATLAALRERGEATSTELCGDVPELARRVVIVPGRNEQTAAGRVLFLLGADGRAVRGRPVGSWRSGRFRWSPSDQRTTALDPREARAELSRRYLTAFGPATAGDLKWWADWTVSDTKRALADVGAVEVELEEGTGYVLPDDLEPDTEPAPWAALLPGLDPTPMGWAERAWYLGDHGPALFDRTGNVGPTVWWNGRIVGGWSQRGDASVVYRLLDDVGADAVAAIDAEVERLAGWLTEPVIPRFRTPMERELSAH